VTCGEARCSLRNAAHRRIVSWYIEVCRNGILTIAVGFSFRFIGRFQSFSTRFSSLGGEPVSWSRRFNNLSSPSIYICRSSVGETRQSARSISGALFCVPLSFCSLAGRFLRRKRRMKNRNQMFFLEPVHHCGLSIINFPVISRQFLHPFKSCGRDQPPSPGLFVSEANIFKTMRSS